MARTRRLDSWSKHLGLETCSLDWERDFPDWPYIKCDMFGLELDPHSDWFRIGKTFPTMVPRIFQSILVFRNFILPSLIVQFTRFFKSCPTRKVCSVWSQFLSRRKYLAKLFLGAHKSLREVSNVLRLSLSVSFCFKNRWQLTLEYKHDSTFVVTDQHQEPA